MSLSAILAEDRRLVILRALDEAPAYRLNESILKITLDKFGHRAGRDVVRADLAWLEEHGLLHVEKIGSQDGELWLARATEEGRDVAQGRHHPGVALRAAG